ncbi:MAG: DUF624 domain-containing protein [Clostridia bacterium]|nr:DUF624 domain-containing protein [Clostridia bacterium]
MGLFGGGYTKEGPGVDKNAPKKKGVFLYFEIFFRKFWKLVQADILYFFTSLPIIMILYVFAPVSSDLIIRIVPDAKFDEQIMSTMQLGFRAMFAIGLFTLWGSGPASAGYAYILRSFTREQHAWILSDFFAKFKENFKQGIVVVIVDLFVFVLGLNALMFYFSCFTGTNSGIWLLFAYITFIMLLIYTFLHYYIYQIMITFECSIGQLYKNSMIFAMAKLPMNVLLTVIMLILLYSMFIVINPMLALVFSAFLWIGVMAFPIAFYASKTIDKTLLNEHILKNKSEKDENDNMDWEEEE